MAIAFLFHFSMAWTDEKGMKWSLKSVAKCFPQKLLLTDLSIMLKFMIIFMGWQRSISYIWTTAQSTEFKSVDRKTAKLSVSLQRRQSNACRGIHRCFAYHLRLSLDVFGWKVRDMFIIHDDCALKDFHDAFQPQEPHNLPAILMESNATQTKPVSLTSGSFNFINLSLFIIRRNGTKKISLTGAVNFHGKSEYSTLAYTTKVN